MNEPANLFVRETVAEERAESLLRRERAGGPVHIERIWGPVATPSAVYDQPHDEWVVLLAGEAELELQSEGQGEGQSETGREVLTLAPGDHLLIPAYRRHRVLRASVDALWLAVHFG